MTRYLGQGNFLFFLCFVCGMMMGMPMKKIEKRIDSTGPEKKKRLVRRDKGILFSFSTRNFVEV